MIRLILHKSIAIDPSMATFSFLTHVRLRFFFFAISKRMQTFDEIHSFIGFHWICHFFNQNRIPNHGKTATRYQVRTTSNITDIHSIFGLKIRIEISSYLSCFLSIFFASFVSCWSTIFECSVPKSLSDWVDIIEWWLAMFNVKCI